MTSLHLNDSSTPIISVIIPAFNAEATLAAAVTSCLQQGRVPYEIIIIDNNSTDKTMEVAKEMACKYSEIKIIREVKQGASYARNLGISLAKAPWIQFLDADDILLPGKWKRQLSLLSSSDKWLIGAFINRTSTGVESTVPVDPNPWRAIMFSGGIGCVHSNLFRKEVLLELQGMNTAWKDHEDYELYFRLLKGKFSYAKDMQVSCIYMHTNPRSLSKIHKVERGERRIKLSIQIIEYLRMHQPKMYHVQTPFFNSSILRHLRLLATYDAKLAEFYRKCIFTKGMAAYKFDRKMKPCYFWTYKLFGFYYMERLRNFVRYLYQWLLGKWKDTYNNMMIHKKCIALYYCIIICFVRMSAY